MSWLVFFFWHHRNLWWKVVLISIYSAKVWDNNKMHLNLNFINKEHKSVGRSPSAGRQTKINIWNIVMYRNKTWHSCCNLESRHPSCDWASIFLNKMFRHFRLLGFKISSFVNKTAMFCVLLLWEQKRTCCMVCSWLCLVDFHHMCSVHMTIRSLFFHFQQL